MKFKEPRLLSICLMAFIGMLVVAFWAAMAQDKMRLIMTLVLSFVALSMVIGRFNLIIKEDYMVVYVFRIIGILPTLVEFQDLVSVKQVGQMKIRITTKKQSFNIYVLKAAVFIDYLKEKTDALNFEIDYMKKCSD